MNPRTSYTKTGTTICGVIFNVSFLSSDKNKRRKSLTSFCAIQGGVALAADTRATAGTIVADKNCEKLHWLAPNILCAGAGTAADCDHVTGKFA